MGADLYIEAIHTPQLNRYKTLYEAAVHKRNRCRPGSPEKSAAQAEVNRFGDLIFSTGCFQDSYNATSILWRLDLSWWTDVIPLCDEHRNLTGENLRTFRQMIQQAKLQLPTREELEANGLTPDGEGSESLAGWHDYFRARRAELLAFLDEAIALDSAVYCSL